ncbi:hypothetical protein [Nocardia stercoris]|uniref:hypothetical protein n=1 Tax=Nocardia stercoris TaxID=2483361 RepID=UPI0011C46CDC|nr:hypothetical protein [Nocardia stercoris]
MRTPGTTPESTDNSDENPNAIVIPLRRRTISNGHSDNSENLQETSLEQPVWQYVQHRKRVGDRRYTGHIKYVHGARSEQLRGELADAIQQLLEWAVQQQSDDHHRQDGAAA